MKNTIPNTSPARFDILKQEYDTRAALDSVTPIIGNRLDGLLKKLIGKKLYKTNGDKTKLFSSACDEVISDLIKYCKKEINNQENQIYFCRLYVTRRGAFSKYLAVRFDATYAVKECHGGGHVCEYVEYEFPLGEFEDDNQTLKELSKSQAISPLPSIESIQNAKIELKGLEKDFKERKEKINEKIPYWARD